MKKFYRCKRPNLNTTPKGDEPDAMKEQMKPEPSPCWGRVLYDFRPQEPTEIGVTQGETVTIHNDVRGWLFVETKAGNFGYIPLKFCTVNGTAPRRDPMELKVRLSKQGRKIKGVNGGDMKCLQDNRFEVKYDAEKRLKTVNNDKCLNNNEKSWCKEQLDNELSTNALLKHAIATPLLVAYARKSTISKDYCMGTEQVSSGITNRDSHLMDTMCPPIPDISSEHSETSESLSSLEETSSVNSSQPDSVRSDDVMDSTPAAFLPVMLIKNPDLVLPDDSTTDSGFSMDEDNEFSDSERYKQILKRKAVDVIFKQNLHDARKTTNYRMSTGTGTKIQKQTAENESYEPNRVSNISGANVIEPAKFRPPVPPKTIPFNQRVSVKHREETVSEQQIVSSSRDKAAEEKVIPRVPVITKPTDVDGRPQGSTFLSRFAVRRSSKDNVLQKGKTAPAVARKPDNRRKQESLTLSRIAARGLPRSKENLLEVEVKPKNDGFRNRNTSLRSGTSDLRASQECLLDSEDPAGKLTVKAEVHVEPRAPASGQEVKGCLRRRDSGSSYRSKSLGGRRWGSMECLLDRNPRDDLGGIHSVRNENNRTGSVECLLDTSSESSDLRFGKPSKPRVIDLQGSQEVSLAKSKSCEKSEKEVENSSQYVSIKTSAPNVGLIKSSQVLNTFRTWLDSEALEKQGCQTFASEQNTKSSTNVNKNGAINSTDGNSDTVSRKETMSTFSHGGLRTSKDTFKCPETPPASDCATVVTEDTVPHVSGGHELNLFVFEKETTQDVDTKVTYRETPGSTSPIKSELAGAIKNDQVSSFESPALEQLDSRTSAYLNADVMTSFKSEETVISATSLISKLNKNRDNHVKLRRVKSMKETSPRKLKERRVDWSPCVQIHFYDPESQIDSREDHVCRTTAMDFANTLEYEGSLV
ncbi:uncharacterized protein LOC135482578 isoform X2 [Lineus longissimus]|uniref:uncharacterized protein LOC135482578 isoform X2 n=1 Tax=Lineus longissimus TaxID=88925 RepID=UPI00315CECAB